MQFRNNPIVKSRLAIRIAALAIISAGFVWVLTRLDWQELGHRLANASPILLVAMCLAWLSAILLRPIRLRYLMGAFGRLHGRHYQTIWAAIVLGMAVNSFAPMRAGDVMAAYFLRQRLRIGMHQSFTAVIIDRLCDFICVIAVFLGALVFMPAIAAWTDQAVMILVGSVLVVIVGFWGAIRYRTLILTLISRCLIKLAPRKLKRWYEIAEELFDGLASIGSWSNIGPIIILSIVMWGLIGCSYWFGLRAVYVGAPISGAAFAMAAVALSFVIPLGPGGLGVFEAAAVLALAVFGVPLEVAIAFAVISHIFQFLTTMLLAALAVLTQSIDYRTLRAASERHQPQTRCSGEPS